jgi:beta-1,4-mannosyltransferase
MHSYSQSISHGIGQLFLRLRQSLTTPSLASFLPSYTAPYSTPFTITTTTNSPTATPPHPPPSSSSPPPPYPRVQPPESRSDRPALLVSSTSWTPDEDFGILLEALGLYETRAREVNRGTGDGKFVLPKVLMVVTGKGPLKAKYMKEVEELQNGSGGGWKWVRCISLWLEAEDYPVLLGLSCFLPLLAVFWVVCL